MITGSTFKVFVHQLLTIPLKYSAKNVSTLFIWSVKKIELFKKPWFHHEMSEPWGFIITIVIIYSFFLYEYKDFCKFAILLYYIQNVPWSKLFYGFEIRSLNLWWYIKNVLFHPWPFILYRYKVYYNIKDYILVCGFILFFVILIV